MLLEKMERHGLSNPITEYSNGIMEDGVWFLAEPQILLWVLMVMFGQSDQERQEMKATTFLNIILKIANGDNTVA